MAIYFPDGQFVDTTEVKTAPGVIITEEGQALVRMKNAQSEGVLIASGDMDNELFEGFAVIGTAGAAINEATDTKVEGFLVPAGGTVKLQFAPVNAEVGIYNLTTGAAITGSTVTDRTITGLPVGANITVTYRRNLNWTQQTATQGHGTAGGYAGYQQGRSGIIRRASTFFTNCYDVSVDWSTVEYITLAPNGHLTEGDETTAIKAKVMALPNTDLAYLGIQFDAL